MKTFKIFFALILALVAFQTVNAQNAKLGDQGETQSIKVYGECGMCERRIEKAALTVEGVTSAIWSVDAKVLTIKYDRFKKDVADNVQKKVASVGHDTEKYTAEDAVYQKLPGCCHYARKSGNQ